LPAYQAKIRNPHALPDLPILTGTVEEFKAFLSEEDYQPEVIVLRPGESFILK
jgi:hypothetical protein